VIDNEDHDRADNSDDKAVNIEARNPRSAKHIEEKAADDGANYAENDIEDEAFTTAIDNLAADKTGNEAQNEPSENRHPEISLVECFGPVGSAGQIKI
jgi:hypothetical protein